MNAMGKDPRTWVADARCTLELARLSCLESRTCACICPEEEGIRRGDKNERWKEVMRFEKVGED